MRPAHPTEQAVGMHYYVSDADGVGGRLREDDEQFRVRELERFETEPIDAPTDAYPHLVFRATLRGWDTNDFAARLSDALGISRERVNWAGTKDKYAVTTQLFSVYGADPEEPDVDGADLEVLGRAGRNLEFGDLAGNAFTLVVTDLDRPDNAAEITEELAAFGDLEDASGSEDAAGTSVGVPNFFGQQRFGSRRPVTHEVGLEIVRDDWEGAVMAYLGRPTEAEPEGHRRPERSSRKRVTGKRPSSGFPTVCGTNARCCTNSPSATANPVPTTFEPHSSASLESPAAVRPRRPVLRVQPDALRASRARAAVRRTRRGDVVCFADTDAPTDSRCPIRTVSSESTSVACVQSRATASAAGRSSPRRSWGPRLNSPTASKAKSSGMCSRTSTSGPPISISWRVLLQWDPPGDPGSDRPRYRDRAAVAVLCAPEGSYATVVAREYLKVDPVSLG